MAQAQTTSTEFGSNTVILVSFLTLYYFVERCLRVVALSCTPRFYNRMRALQKDRIFFGILMGVSSHNFVISYTQMFLGLLITALSTPLCVYATVKEWNSSVDPGKSWSLEPQTRTCITFRSILWVSELNRLDMYSLYILHHTGSILSLVSWLHFRWPNLLFLILFSTLASEIPGDLVFLVSTYKETLDEPIPKLERFRTQLMRVNTLQYTVLRGAGILTVTWLMWSNAPGVSDRSMAEQVYAYSLLALYSVFCISYVLRQLRKC